MQFKFYMLTFGTGIVILYIAKECVRLRPIPPPAAGYFPTLHTGPGTGVYAYNSIKNNVGILYLVCAMVCIL